MSDTRIARTLWHWGPGSVQRRALRRGYKAAREEDRSHGSNELTYDRWFLEHWRSRECAGEMVVEDKDGRLPEVTHPLFGACHVTVLPLPTTTRTSAQNELSLTSFPRPRRRALF